MASAPDDREVGLVLRCGMGHKLGDVPTADTRHTHYFSLLQHYCYSLTRIVNEVSAEIVSHVTLGIRSRQRNSMRYGKPRVCLRCESAGISKCVNSALVKIDGAEQIHERGFVPTLGVCQVCGCPDRTGRIV